MKMLGHNNGPTMESGASWRKHCWTKARRELMPTLPIEILRNRVARARALGLDYRSYASIRATSGHDVIAFLFSSNALRVFPRSHDLPEDRILKLGNIQNANRLAALHAPLTAQSLLKALPEGMPPLFEACFTAPNFRQTWGETRAVILEQFHAMKLPRDGVVVVGDTSQERAWSEAARLAGYVSAEQFFNNV